MSCCESLSATSLSELVCYPHWAAVSCVFSLSLRHTPGPMDKPTGWTFHVLLLDPLRLRSVLMTSVSVSNGPVWESKDTCVKNVRSKKYFKNKYLSKKGTQCGKTTTGQDRAGGITYVLSCLVVNAMRQHAGEAALLSLWVRHTRADRRVFDREPVSLPKWPIYQTHPSIHHLTAYKVTVHWSPFQL